MRRALSVIAVVASVAVSVLIAGVAAPARADERAATSAPERAAPQGVAVLALGDNAHDEAFALARALYGSRLRPIALDEVRARVLAGGAPPANASRELRELAEIREGLRDDAAGRRLLAGIAQQLGVEALLVVKVDAEPIGAPPPSGAGNTDAGATTEAAGNAALSSMVTARLFLTAPGEFDAARYFPDPGPVVPAAWKSTVSSLEARYPQAARVAAPAAATQPAPLAHPEDGKSSPFYASGWFWGAVGGAALIATAFYFASRDTSSDSIHLQMHVPK